MRLRSLTRVAAVLAMGLIVGALAGAAVPAQARGPDGAEVTAQANARAATDLPGGGGSDFADRRAAVASDEAADDPAWLRVAPPSHGRAITALDALYEDVVWLASDLSSDTEGNGVRIFRLQRGTWSELAVYSGWQVADIDMLSPDEGWLVGTNGDRGWESYEALIVHYRNGHFEWRRAWEEPPFEGRLYGVDMTSPQAGFAVGVATAGTVPTDGIVLRYADGIWSEVARLPREALVAIDMAGSADGWAVGANGATLRYRDGVWTEVPSPSSGALSALDLFDRDNGWAVGAAGHAVRLTDGVWAVADTGIPGDLASVSVTSADSARVAGTTTTGEAGLIGRLEDDKWAQEPAPPWTGPLSAIDMLSPDLGWVAGRAGNVPWTPSELLRYGPPMPAPSEPTREPVEYAGTFFLAEEAREFVPTGAGCAGRGRGWWLETADGSGFGERLRALFPPGPDGSLPDDVLVYTRFLGRLSPQGRYGHVQQYEYAIEVIKELDMVRLDACPYVFLPALAGG